MAPTSTTDGTRAGLLAGVGAFLAWGFLPVYWKLLGGVPALEILCHRVAWSALFLGVILAAQRRWREVGAALRHAPTRRLLAVSSVLIGGNWFTYIWAVHEGRVLEASLGYYVNPLVNALLGVVFLGDRLRPLQVAAILLAAAGVTNLVVAHGSVPWVSLVLAVSFAFYGLVRKAMRVEALPGLLVETVALTVPALAYLGLLALTHAGAFATVSPSTDLLLVGAGAATSLPLLAFAFSARRLRLVTVGVLQYIAPTCMFLLGVLAYGEPFSSAHLVTFSLIWGGVALYAGEAFSVSFRRVRAA